MRVAMVSEHASPLAVLGGEDAGGQNVHVAALAERLGARGVPVVVHTRRDDAAAPRRVPFARGAEVDHVDAGPPKPIAKDGLLPHMDAFAAQLREQWEHERPDVVHAHFWMSAHAALRAAEPLGIPVVQTFHALGAVKRRHQGAADTSPPQRLDIEASVMRRARRIVATCSDEVFELVRLGADRRRITVIPCGVDVERFTPRGAALARGKRPRLVAAGRLVERKGIDDVVRALTELPGVELLVAGGGPRETLADDPNARRLMALAAELDVRHRVTFLGQVGRTDMPAVLRSADVVTCVPWYEPFGIVPLEAMACGRPVVASAVGGMIDTVVHDVTGVHVPPRNPHRLARALGELLADDARRGALGGAGAWRARRRYGWDGIAAATLDVYCDLVGVPLRRRPALALAAEVTA